MLQLDSRAVLFHTRVPMWPPFTHSLVARRLTLLVAAMGLLSLTGCTQTQPQNVPQAHVNDPAGPARPGAANSIKPTPPASAPVDQARVPTASTVIARVGDKTITYSDLEEPLMQSYGLNILLQLVQLDLAKQHAAKDNVAVTPADFQRERELTLKQMFPDSEVAEYPELLDRLLAQQHITKTEFEIVMNTNTYLRKIAEPALMGKITEQNVRDAFEIIYGARVKVQHIQVATLQKAAEAKRRIEGGESFETVARDMSENQQTAMMGGDLPPFSRQQQGIPEAIKDAAFSMKVGEVSDPISTAGSYQIVKLERMIPPNKVAKYDDEMKALMRQKLLDNLTFNAIKDLRGQLAAQALQPSVMRITEPRLKAQYEARLANMDQKEKAEQRLRNDAHHTPPPPQWPTTDTTDPTTTPAPSTTRPAANPTFGKGATRAASRPASPVAKPARPSSTLQTPQAATQPIMPVMPVPSETADPAPVPASQGDQRPPATESGASPDMAQPR